MRNPYSIFSIGLISVGLVGCATAPVLTSAELARRPEAVRVLLDQGTDVNSPCEVDFGKTKAERTLLDCAIWGGNLDAMKLLLDKGAAIEGKSGFTPPLMIASLGGKIDAVRLLLERGAAVNAKDPGFTAFTALVFAAAYGHPDIMRLLIDKGADVDEAMVALQHCNTERNGAEWAGMCAAGAKRLEKITQKQAAYVHAGTGGISKEELSAIVQAAVEGTTKAQAKTAEQAKGVESDIDKPVYKHAEQPNNFAVVVGIGKYSDIPDAQFAERDAEAVKSHLLALGFPKNVDENSRVFFYFSGHGAPDPQTGQAFLLPYDGDPGFLENTGYPIKRLYEKLSSLKAKEVIVALDACFSGAGGRSVLAKGARPLVMKADAAAVPRNLTVFAAAAGDQITSTLEDQGHGTFTYYFLKGLSGGAKDGSGAVTARSLHHYLKPKVQDAARRQNRDQEPVLHSQGDRELVRF